MVVIDQPIAMVPAVELNDQSFTSIKQVWTAHEATLLVTKWRLRFGPRESGIHEEDP